MTNIILESGTQFFYSEFIPSSINEPTNIILFIHGAYQTDFSFKNIKNELYKENTTSIIVSINLTFFGKSKNLLIDVQNDDIIEISVLEDFIIKDLNLFYFFYKNKYPNIERWDIFSYSFGTYVSLKWIFKHQPNINNLVLCCPYGLFPNTGIFGKIIGTYFKYDLYGKFVKFCNIFFKYKNYVIEPHNFSNMIMSNTFDLSEGFLTNCFIDEMKNLGPMGINTSIIFGSNDIISPMQQSNIVQMLYPKIRCYTISDVDHIGIIESMELAKILKFIFFKKEPKVKIEYIKIIWNIWENKKRLNDYYLNL